MTVLIVIVVVVLLLFFGARLTKAYSSGFPGFKKEDIPQEKAVASFVDAFFKRDLQARQLLNVSNKTLFTQGYGPKVGVPNDPEVKGEKFSDIRKYFIRKLYLDLNSIDPLEQSAFQNFIDQMGYSSDKTLICIGEIAVKYNMNLQGSFNFETEFAKVPAGPHREALKNCWINDAILGTELRLLGWIYQQLFGVPYVTPGNR